MELSKEDIENVVNIPNPTLYDKNRIYLQKVRDNVKDKYRGKYILVNSDKTVFVCDSESQALTNRKDNDSYVDRICLESSWHNSYTRNFMSLGQEDYVRISQC